MACCDVFLTCPVEMLPTLQLKTGRLPVLMGSLQVRLVMFMTGLLSSAGSKFVFTLPILSYTVTILSVRTS